MVVRIIPVDRQVGSQGTDKKPLPLPLSGERGAVRRGVDNVVIEGASPFPSQGGEDFTSVGADEGDSRYGNGVRAQSS